MASKTVLFKGRQVIIRTFTVDDMIDIVSRGEQLHIWAMIRQVLSPDDKDFVGQQPLDLKIIEESKALVNAFTEVNPSMTEGVESFLEGKKPESSGETKSG